MSTAQPKLPLGSIVRCFISKCDYQVTGNWTGPADDKTPDSLNVTTSFGEHQERGLVQVGVSVVFGRQALPAAPYSGEIEAIVILSGLLNVMPADQLQQHAIRVGAPIAYGKLRDFISTLTATGPYARTLMLPIVPATVFL